MIFFSIYRKQLDSKVRKELKKGLLAKEEVREIAESLLQELKQDQQTEDLRTKRLRIGIPILFGLFVLMNIASAIRTGSVSVIHLVLLGFLFVGIWYAFWWLKMAYLREFVAITRTYYPEISAEYADKFFTKH
ncbi:MULTISPECIES: hypothetical protein [unclassified Streptococcus]|uniref:hypothetical protein n=1 Tax=unclassified Streptococcus TaxID=2608887 RepID=UPI0010723F8B|nr:MULTISPECIES: hypothetical protein [unclassified Streptococcus]MBF0786492.1 hypothetical protein [Streptococcus sp. 19428wC2_LYSM12]MCQ9212352.1 hypothetical protein [Streptococcus sp. B01]MCQ9213683.1 hypothetical protein [Streptococcus sp. O1]TFV06656.1 hypothetical protein E4T79_00910 [Streptococcus sp. LYSM12]